MADAITSQANTEGWATKLTYIDKSGIFTGTLSANTVKAVQINASQITAGTIATDRLDTAALKSVLVTASNIEALTLNVIRGKSEAGILTAIPSTAAPKTIPREVIRQLPEALRLVLLVSVATSGSWMPRVREPWLEEISPGTQPGMSRSEPP